eukprot:m.1073649 g.1073649  ORF g.1073649 m.1073649 type:complete len:170 (-) comp24235_c0_seq11:628-1137(-)
MFYQMRLTHEVLLHPENFGPDIHTRIKQQLYAEVESTCSGKYGFIVSVIAIVGVGDGEIIPGRGHVLFEIKYDAVVFRPFKGEVVDAMVTAVTKAGIFADVGPLKVFVSKHWIPEDMEYDGNANPPCFKTADEADKIEVDDGIRIEILATRVDAAEIFATGSLAGEYLG